MRRPVQDGAQGTAITTPDTVWVHTALPVVEGSTGGTLTVGSRGPDGAGRLLGGVELLGWAGAERVGAGWLDPVERDPVEREALGPVLAARLDELAEPPPGEPAAADGPGEDPAPRGLVAGPKPAPAGPPGFTGGNHEVFTGGSPPVVTPRIGASTAVPVA